MPDLMNHKRAERLAFLSRTLVEESAWGPVVSRAFPDLIPDHSVESRRKPRKQPRFYNECREAFRVLPGYSDLARPRRAFYRELVERTASDPLGEWLRLSDGEVRSLWNLAPGRVTSTTPSFP